MVKQHIWTALLLSCLLCIQSCVDSSESSDKSHPIAYDVYTTTGGDSIFEMGQFGEINAGLMGLIDRFTDSTQAHFAVFDWTMPEFADRLISQMEAFPNAQVSVIIDPKKYALKKPPHKVKMIEKLEAFATRHPNFRLENTDNPQAGLLNTADPNPRRLMHNKFFIFRNLSSTSIDDGAYSIAISSANLTYSEVGESNEMVVIYGDEGLYERFFAYWQAMAVSEANYSFKVSHSYSNVHDHLAYFFPMAGEGDILLDIANQLELGLREARQPVKIRIVSSMWHRCRKAFASRLVNLHKKYDADIHILLKEDLDVSLEAFQILSELPPGSIRFLPSRHPKLRYGIHSKLMLVDGPISLTENAPAERQKLTFTGSHNWNYDALRTNSETWIRIANAGVYEELEAHWEELWAKGEDSTKLFEGVPFDSTMCE